MSRFHLGIALLTLLGLAAPVFAQGDLKQFQDRRTIAAQKTIKQASEAISEAKRLLKTDPAMARDILAAAKAEVSGSQNLSETEVADWLQRINSQLTQVQGVLQQQEKAQAEAVRREVDK